MSNAAGALAGLRALEDEAIAVHKRVEEALEGCRSLLIGAIVERYGKTYQVDTVRAYRGLILCYGVRYYPNKNEIGTHGYSLGEFRDCKILKYPNDGDAPTRKIVPQRTPYLPRNAAEAHK